MGKHVLNYEEVLEENYKRNLRKRLQEWEGKLEDIEMLERLLVEEVNWVY